MSYNVLPCSSLKLAASSNCIFNMLLIFFMITSFIFNKILLTLRAIYYNQYNVLFN